ncbi:MAG: hypothetical protein NTY45_09285 [Elusimicrobia bacterium]|nr:hypothetical protein [Elusimicrobiota bacterium]
MTAEKLRILVIGASGYSGATCVNWDVKELPTISDFDFVVVNMFSLFSGTVFQQERMLEIKEGLSRLLSSDGQLAVLSNANTTIAVDDGENKYSCPSSIWSPIEFQIKKEKTSTFCRVSPTGTQYRPTNSDPPFSGCFLV